ncbi:MAG: hypothetical protein EAZ57_05450 [Cytophagales bacterium]|nr:MAG: hypothetical protein EAZ67_06130 [Cytophagales bacterium]TAF60990.1 MAG: hypothetical protein EAZ57_05450 [Cytophagales bacterium]
MRYSIVFILLLFCVTTGAAQQDSTKQHKHEIGFNTGTSWGGIEVIRRFEYGLSEELPFNKAHPLEFSYKYRLGKSSFFRLSTGVWARAQRNDRKSIYSFGQTAKSSSFLFSLGIGCERRKMLSKNIRLVLGLDVVMRRMSSMLNIKGVERLGESVYTHNQQFYNPTLSPFVELHYLLGKRFLVSVQANLRVSYLSGISKTVYVYDASSPLDTDEAHYDDITYSTWLFQVSPVSNIALYYCF